MREKCLVSFRLYRGLLKKEFAVFGGEMKMCFFMGSSVNCLHFSQWLPVCLFHFIYDFTRAAYSLIFAKNSFVGQWCLWGHKDLVVTNCFNGLG